MSSGANYGRYLFRLPVRKIKNTLLRRLAMILAYPLMVLATLLASTINACLIVLVAVAMIVWHVPKTYWTQQRDFHRTIGPAWRGEPL